MSKRAPLHLFEGYGIEPEYAIVDRHSLDVQPLSDYILRTPDGKYTCELCAGTIGWSNEFVLHVIELKTNGPAVSLSGLTKTFDQEVGLINRILEPKEAQFMPTAMHPWMDPALETRLWPHKNRRIYQTYDRIFGCQRHGWANIQSMQLNLPFYDDEEFGRLHAAVRMLLPIIPALAASSPVVEGKVTGVMDNRLQYYRVNQCQFPSITGELIPEPIYTRIGYEDSILKKIYQDISLHDPQKSSGTSGSTPGAQSRALTAAPSRFAFWISKSVPGQIWLSLPPL